jgi:toxin ParE1/3/4
VTIKKRSWPVRLSAAAERDFQDILRWTATQFGQAQARIYAKTISDALQALSAGPEAAAATKRDDIMPGLLFLHVARAGRRGRHFVLFRVRERGKEKYVDVLRLLHDSMDFVRHLPPEEDA